MAQVMKRILFALLLVAGLFVLPAGACEQSNQPGPAVPHTESTRASTVGAALQASGQIFETHRCEFPDYADSIASAAIEPKKAIGTVGIEIPADIFVSSLGDLRHVLEVRGRYLAASAPPGFIPLYLLTARLRC
jgi:hypothetical protein